MLVVIMWGGTPFIQARRMQWTQIVLLVINYWLKALTLEAACHERKSYLRSDPPFRLWSNRVTGKA